MVRRAISIAMLAGASAGCASPKQPDVQPLTPTVQIAEPQPSSEDKGLVTTDASREKAEENPFFTPEKALRAALSEPLHFVAQLNGDAFGTMTHVCLWQNSKVLIRSHYCEIFQQQSSEGTKDQDVHIFIHSPRGETIEISAEAHLHKSVYEIKRDNYVAFEIRYVDLSAATPRYRHDRSPKEYEAFIRKINDSLEQEISLPHCNTSSRKIKCENIVNSEALQAASEEFWKEPGKNWYDFLQMLKALYTKQGFR